jgi:hypothetical protein
MKIPKQAIFEAICRFIVKLSSSCWQVKLTKTRASSLMHSDGTLSVTLVNPKRDSSVKEYMKVVLL